MSQSKRDDRVRNPFHDWLTSEMIEEPKLYRKMFSQQILVGETLEVFQPINVVLLGAQGMGKSMVLNLLRYSVLTEWIGQNGRLPHPLKNVQPFVGISINLSRVNFQAFGRRSVSRVMTGRDDSMLDAVCAGDFVNHYLTRELLRALAFLNGEAGERFRLWANIADGFVTEGVVRSIATLPSWFGYYESCATLVDLTTRVEERLGAWFRFQNTNIERIPEDVWSTKTNPGAPLHELANLLRALPVRKGQRRELPLFVVVDQYEELPALNQRYGTELQRVINSMIKARDPVVFFKIGARTYDWGREIRVSGAQSRVEVRRDYVPVNLSEVLMRREHFSIKLFEDLAKDVAHRRLKEKGHYRVKRDSVPAIFGNWEEVEEALRYFKDSERYPELLRLLPRRLRRALLDEYEVKSKDPLEVRLIGAWCLQRIKRGERVSSILQRLPDEPWKSKWWWKERVAIGLLQLASIANQRPYYYGWKSLLELSGGNIAIFLLICSEVWDEATKRGFDPLAKAAIKPLLQSEGVRGASEIWRTRDREDKLGGRRRYEVVSRFGAFIHEYLVRDWAISNPGHSGFSLSDSELFGSAKGQEVLEFLGNAVSWSILEERRHKSKQGDGSTRRKWYLHAILSPSFVIPHTRVKEPLYVSVEQMHEWIFGSGGTPLVPRRRPSRSGNQLTLPLGETK